MAAVRMTTTNDPTRNDRDYLDEHIYEYNIAATGSPTGG